MHHAQRPFFPNLIHEKHLLSGMVCKARLELNGRSVEAFSLAQGGNEGDAEVFVGRSGETSQEMVFRGPDEVPVDEVAGSVEDAPHLTFAEETALNNGGDRLMGVGIVEFEGPGKDDSFRELTGVGREVDHDTVAIDRIGIGVGIGMIPDI